MQRNSNLRQMLAWIAGGILFLLFFAITRPSWCPEFLANALLTNSGYFWAAGFYILAAVVWRKRAFFNRRNNFRIGVLAASGVLGLVCLELTVRWVSPPPRFLPTLPALPDLRERRAGIQLRGVSQASVFTTNAWGMRGDPVPADWDNRFTILAIGGSTTLCYYLDDHKTWPYLMQEKIKPRWPDVWVGNAGFEGHTTRGSLLVMDAIVRKVRPDALVFLLGFNDMALSLDQKALRKGLRYDKTRHDVQRYLNPLDRFRLYQIGRQWKKALIDRVPIVSPHSHSTPRFEPVPEQTFSPVPEDLREWLPSLPMYERNIHELIRLTRDLNCRALFLTQPLLFDDTPYWRRRRASVFFIKGQVHTVSGATYWRMLQIFNRKLQEVCEKEHAPCVDLASDLPHDPKYFYDMVHFTEAGAEAVADFVSREVLLRLRKP